MIKWFPLTFQNIDFHYASTIDWLHDYIIFFLLFVVIFVGGLLLSFRKTKYIRIQIYEIPLLEFIWTSIPGVILIFIGLPSLLILYSSETLNNADLRIKITGHQWYWTYDYSDFSDIEFDSYLKPAEDLLWGEPRLLETDNHIILPVGTKTCFIISSSDVLHRWSLPSLGLKADANPGRINILYLDNTQICGLFYGQCSEICGANHSFIPITLEITNSYNFLGWVLTF